MTAAERALIEHFFKDLSDRYGNAGCNDFNLKEFMPDLWERNSFVRDYHIRNGDPEEYESVTPDDDQGEDYRLADFQALGQLKRTLLAGTKASEVSRPLNPAITPEPEGFCNDCNQFGPLITKSNHHGGTKRVCCNRAACNARSPG